MDADSIDSAETMPGDERPLVAGRYRIVRRLGQGGMGSVHLAEDIQLDNKLFAIKMLPSILVANKRAYRQLKDEALLAMRLVHQNIVQVRAFEENNGNPFLVMDYVEGQSLDDLLAEKGRLSPEETERILEPVADALDYAHGEGVVHRDVKPANVMIRADGHPFVLDFGIAREIQETLTRVTGKLSSGTLLYMSPEQLTGKSPKAPQDVYSFAAMAYECLQGEPPFSRGQIEYQIINETPEPLECGGAFAKRIMQGLAKDPQNRPATCKEMFSREKREAASRVEVLPPQTARIMDGRSHATTATAMETKTRYEAGDECEFTLPGNVKMTMVYVAPGEFRMGSNDSEAYSDEKPVHEVRITEGYWIGKYPVTQKQWNALVSANNPSFDGGKPVAWFSRSGGGRGEVSGMDTSDFPMENISWDDCDALVKAMNRNSRDGAVYSIPTEAQWEFAACGGTKSRRYKYSGGNNLDAVGWYCGNSGNRTHSVLDKNAGNELGIVGMSGNVWEWCRDWYDGDYYAKSPTNDPCNTAAGANRVLRGGSWNVFARSCRSAYRSRYGRGYRIGNLGFRLSCSAGVRSQGAPPCARRPE